MTVNLSEAFAYIESFTNFEKKTTMMEREYRLDRMRFLLSSFGNPERAFKTIHVAGSKGKGSTAAFAASILAASGEKTGLYTSPHVASYRERITVNGEEYPDGAYVSAVGRIRDFVESMDEADFPGGTSPTTFELLTLLGFLMFKESSCRWAVIETGIGGRLDATNLILPEVSVLTPIELEHTDILGATIPAIAREKAGIIKPGVPVFSAAQNPEAEAVFRKRAEECGVPITFANEAVRFLKTRLSREGTEMEAMFTDGESLKARLSLLGGFQAENACLAFLSCREAARRSEILFERDAAVSGLESSRLPGRTEIVPYCGTSFIIDGAHTPVSVRKVRDAVREVFGERGVLIFGAVAGKDIQGMAQVLASSFGRILISTPGRFKESRPGEVFETFKSLNPAAEFIPEPEEAMKRALALAGKELPVIVTGSFYMAAEIRKLIVR